MRGHFFQLTQLSPVVTVPYCTLLSHSVVLNCFCFFRPLSLSLSFFLFLLSYSCLSLCAFSVSYGLFPRGLQSILIQTVVAGSFRFLCMHQWMSERGCVVFLHACMWCTWELEIYLFVEKCVSARVCMCFTLLWKESHWVKASGQWEEDYTRTWGH